MTTPARNAAPDVDLLLTASHVQCEAVLLSDIAGSSMNANVRVRKTHRNVSIQKLSPRYALSISTDMSSGIRKSSLSMYSRNT